MDVISISLENLHKINKRESTVKLKGKMIIGTLMVCLFVGGGVTALATASSSWIENLSTIESNFNEVIGLLNGEKKIVQAKEIEIDELNTEIDTINNDLDTKNTEIERLNEEINELEADKSSNQELITHLQLNVELLNKEKFSLLDKIKVLEQQISDLKTEISTLNGTVDELEAENNLKDKQISNNEDKIKLMESEIEKLKNYTTDQVEDLTEEANVSES